MRSGIQIPAVPLQLFKKRLAKNVLHEVGDAAALWRKMLQPILAAFVLIFIAELVDKTQLVILGLAIKYKSPMKVFSGALLAHSLMDALAIMLGFYFGFIFSSSLVSIAVGLVFIALGSWTLIKLYWVKGEEKERKELVKSIFLSSFLIVLLTEFGDKTQIAAGLISAKYLAPVLVFLGTFLALATVIAVNVTIASKIAEKLPRKTIKLASGVLFIFFGLMTLLF